MAPVALSISASSTCTSESHSPRPASLYLQSLPISALGSALHSLLPTQMSPTCKLGIGGRENESGTQSVCLGTPIRHDRGLQTAWPV